MNWFKRTFAQKSVLDRLEEGVLDEAVPLTTLLRQVIVLGGRAASQPLRTWAQHELRGYTEPDTELPDYRLLHALIQTDARSVAWEIKAQTISVLDLLDFAQDVVKEQLPMTYGVGKIEALIASADPTKPVKFSLPGAAELARMMSYERRHMGVFVDVVYWSVHPSSLQDVIDQVRNRLAQFVAELRATMPMGAPEPTPGQVRQAVQQIITIDAGDHSPVTVYAPVAQANQESAAIASIRLELPDDHP
ncbi:AbiTii domain-containing protein [Kitasatospora sp. NBC_01302]|uniref:AbiTii domain-containing protein n=1 Tax=Kitasatospora sp. NBC_01302 TaxID=2903575 RepID=UPI002E10EC01|nr:hypothetical protein OG294_20065 [Kitasatospora sp. NBC_01302]